MKTKSCLSWFGSDAGVAPELARLLDPCSHVGIAFFGGGSILPHLKARAIVANDKHVHAMNFYRVISGVYGVEAKHAMIWRCEKTLSHPVELRDAWDILNTKVVASDPVDRAWAYWTVCWLSRKGAGGTTKLHKAKTSHRWTANGGTNASRLRSTTDDLSAWASEFERCEFSELDFRDFAKKLKDQLGCGSYWDAPWPDAGDDYEESFSEADHRDMEDILSGFEHHRVVVRYGDHPLIRELYDASHWHITERGSRNQANGSVDELWITNFAP